MGEGSVVEMEYADKVCLNKTCMESRASDIVATFLSSSFKCFLILIVFFKPFLRIRSAAD